MYSGRRKFAQINKTLFPTPVKLERPAFRRDQAEDNWIVYDYKL